MSFDLEGVRAAVGRHGRVARVVVAGHQGSAPREAGAAMLVWPGGQSGTIGGGALEHQAAETARAMLAHGPVLRLERVALGPAVGQCCGGAVSLLYEVYEAGTLPVAEHGLIARRVEGAQEMPLALRRMLAEARGQGTRPAPALMQGWMVEPLMVPARALWVWGAGHVGRAIVAVLAPVPDFAITWVDTDLARFPDVVPEAVVPLVAVDPGDLVTHAPHGAEHLILTYSHALDLDLCHRLLGHGFARAGLIGSATKWARFRARLAALGHRPEAIGRITCPIGDPALGKHPQAIALGVGAALLRASAATGAQERAS
ncbi:MAG: xanthine dehydrogenase accessory protein XdhC [Rhodobacteraceae bacterium]|nr:xanthine dehydrogenase accessory protein XdhC [Paracoccaceae bacterium]